MKYFTERLMRCLSYSEKIDGITPNLRKDITKNIPLLFQNKDIAEPEFIKAIGPRRIEILYDAIIKWERKYQDSLSAYEGTVIYKGDTKYYKRVYLEEC